jgi:hypothetical protein
MIRKLEEELIKDYGQLEWEFDEDSHLDFNID